MMVKSWIFSMLLIPTMNISGLKIDSSNIKVFPDGHGIAGVFQVSHMTDRNLAVYAFNVSEARELCLALGVTIASQAQVEEALRQGLETCRYGWIDEHFAVIPRVTASEICGRNQIGLVKWRASVTKHFDVFCFNQTDSQLEGATTDTPLTTREQNERSSLPRLSVVAPSISAPRPTPVIHHRVLSPHPSSPPTSPLSPLLSPSRSPSTFIHIAPHSPEEADNELPQSMSTAGSTVGVMSKVLIITTTLVLLLTAVAILWYFKLKKSCFLCWSTVKQREYVETEEWAHTWVKDKQEDQREPEEDGTEEAAEDVSININSDSMTEADADAEP